eukprot:1158973-Pelagomonas_calceolata.AAC.19
MLSWSLSQKAASRGLWHPPQDCSNFQEAALSRLWHLSENNLDVDPGFSGLKHGMLLGVATIQHSTYAKQQPMCLCYAQWLPHPAEHELTAGAAANFNNYPPTTACGAAQGKQVVAEGRGREHRASKAGAVLGAHSCGSSSHCRRSRCRRVSAGASEAGAFLGAHSRGSSSHSAAATAGAAMAHAGMGAHSCGSSSHSAADAAEEPLQEHLRQEQFWGRTAVAAAATQPQP